MKFKLLTLLLLPAIGLMAQSDPVPTTPPAPVYTPGPQKVKVSRNYKLDNDGVSFAKGIKADELKTLVYA